MLYSLRCLCTAVSPADGSDDYKFVHDPERDHGQLRAGLRERQRRQELYLQDHQSQVYPRQGQLHAVFHGPAQKPGLSAEILELGDSNRADCLCTAHGRVHCGLWLHALAR